MKLTLHKLLEGFLITSDEKIEKGWKGIAFKKDVKGFVFNHFYTENPWYADAKKVIAQQDQIDFSDLKEEDQKKIGWFDVEILAIKDLEDYFGSDLELTEKGTHYINAFSTGFQKHQELSDKMFTLEDIRKIAQAAFTVKSNNETLIDDFDKWFEKRIQSLSQKSWEIEVEMEKYDITIEKSQLFEDYESYNLRPKFTNNKLTILKIL
jgi:hypothetical protein